MWEGVELRHNTRIEVEIGVGSVPRVQEGALPAQQFPFSP